MNEIAKKIIASAEGRGVVVSDELKSAVELFGDVMKEQASVSANETVSATFDKYVEQNKEELSSVRLDIGKVAQQIEAMAKASVTNVLGSRAEFRKHLEANREAIASIANGARADGKVRFKINAVATDPILGGGKPDGVPVPVLIPGIGRAPILQSSFLEDCNVANLAETDAQSVTILDKTPYEGHPEWWGEKNADGTPMRKSQMSFGFSKQAIDFKTIAVIVEAYKYHLKDLDFLENEIYTSLEEQLMLEIRKAILTGDTTTNTDEPDGGMTKAVAYNNPDASGTVDLANVADAINAMATQVRNAGYPGQIVARISPAIAAELRSSKDKNGNYLDYDRVLTGILLREDYELSGGQALVGIPHNFNVRFAGGIDISIITASVRDADGTVVGTTDEYNIVAFRAETRTLTWMYSNDLPSLVKTDDIATIIADITKPAA